MKTATAAVLIAAVSMLAGAAQAQSPGDTIDVPTRPAPPVSDPAPSTITPTPRSPARPQAAPTASPTAPNPGGTCREATMNVIIAGRPQQAYGQACQGPDGAWRFVK